MPARAGPSRADRSAPRIMVRSLASASALPSAMAWVGRPGSAPCAPSQSRGSASSLATPPTADERYGYPGPLRRALAAQGGDQLALGHGGATLDVATAGPVHELVFGHVVVGRRAATLAGRAPAGVGDASGLGLAHPLVPHRLVLARALDARSGALPSGHGTPSLSAAAVGYPPA